MSLVEELPERSGYLLKDRVSDIGVLTDALRRIAQGECVIDPTIVSRLIRHRRNVGPLSRLTDREREVLELMAEGHSNSGIRQQLVLSPKTVEATSTTSSANSISATHRHTSAASSPSSPSSAPRRDKQPHNAREPTQPPPALPSRYCPRPDAASRGSTTPRPLGTSSKRRTTSCSDARFLRRLLRIVVAPGDSASRGRPA
jgi:hypothetical protein